MTAPKNIKQYILLDEWNETFFTGTRQQIENAIYDALTDSEGEEQERLTSLSVFEMGKTLFIDVDMEPKVSIREVA